MAKENVKAVIFDMDGVLIDSETICDIIWKQLADEMKLPDIDDAIFECRGCNNDLMAKKLTARYGKDFNCPKFFEDFSKYFHKYEFENGIELMPGVLETLDYLKSNGYKIGLSTSTRRESAFRQLTNCKIIQYFESQTYGDEIVHSKPAPDIYLKSCAALGIEPKYCIGVEDSPNGVRSVFNAGFKAVMVPDKIEPDEEIKKLCWKIFKPVSKLIELL